VIYFHVPKPDTPSGGVWFLYKLVDLLNQAGLPALAWQKTNDYLAWWDANPIPRRYLTTEIRLGQGDVLVVPEVLWPHIHRDGVRSLCFVQNYVWLDRLEFLRDPGEVLVCSRFLANHMQRVFDVKALRKVTPFLELSPWRVGIKQKNWVLVMARRNPYHQMLKVALEAEGFGVVYVTEPQTQAQLADLLAECDYYAHLTHPEGFPMACLEAMRSGAVVVGTTGGGGNEFMFHRETAWVVQDPDNGGHGSPSRFVAEVVDGLKLLRGDETARERIRQQAYDWSLCYTAEATTLELREVFG